tara:strand:- start:2102 stop:3175 length:1074 start_codon:yes stop_codon:yes gene_type:complete
LNPQEKIQTIDENRALSEDTIYFSDLLLIFAKNIKTILIVPSVLCFFAIVYVTFFAKPIFVSESKIMSSSSNANISQAAGIAAQFGFSIGNTSQNQEWVYPEIVKSRTIAKSMLKRKFDSKEYGPQKYLLQILTYGNNSPQYGLDTLMKAGVLSFQGMTKIKKNGEFYDLSIHSKEPNLARDILGALIEELDAHQKEYNREKTSEARLFIEDRILETKKELELAEENLKTFNDRNRRIENSPSLQLQRSRLAREVSVLTGVYTTLKQQLETTKIEELKESNYVVVLDEPEAPLFASKPNKKIIVIITGIIGILFGIIIAIFEEVWNYINRTEGVKIIKAKKKFKENILDLIPKFFKT